MKKLLTINRTGNVLCHKYEENLTLLCVKHESRFDLSDDELASLGVREFPTLLIMDDDKVVARLDGFNTNHVVKMFLEKNNFDRFAK